MRGCMILTSGWMWRCGVKRWNWSPSSWRSRYPVTPMPLLIGLTVTLSNLPIWMSGAPKPCLPFQSRNGFWSPLTTPFNTLVAAVQAAGLVDTLKGDGPFTVFAPTDEAFAALPAGTVENLLKPENKDQLVAVLTYHVVPGKVMSSDIAGKKLDVASVEGDTIAIDATDGVKVDDATVIAADVETSNGVIHVIDKVILPSS